MTRVPVVAAEDTPTVDLPSLIASLEERLPVLQVFAAEDTVRVGCLDVLVRDAVIYLKRAQAVASAQGARL